MPSDRTRLPLNKSVAIKQTQISFHLRQSRSESMSFPSMHALGFGSVCAPIRPAAVGVMMLVPVAAGAQAPTPDAAPTQHPDVTIQDGIAVSPGDQVLASDDVLRHWDGRSELLLTPPSTQVETGKRFSAFTVGAAFARDAPGSTDCYTAAGRAQYVGGRLQVEIYPELSPAKPFKLDSVDINDDGRWTRILASGHCRFTMTMTTKLMKDGRWWKAGGLLQPPARYQETVYPHPETIETVNKSIETIDKHRVPSTGSNALGDAAREPPTTFYQELGMTSLRFTLAGTDGAKALDVCPVASGTIIFSPEGVHLRLPWSIDPLITPGLVRDVDHRATTLILQNTECRTELQITREIDDGGAWQRSPLAPTPVELELP